MDYWDQRSPSNKPSRGCGKKCSCLDQRDSNLRSFIKPLEISEEVSNARPRILRMSYLPMRVVDVHGRNSRSASTLGLDWWNYKLLNGTLSSRTIFRET